MMSPPSIAARAARLFSSGASRAWPRMLRQIVVEAETPGDSRTMFRLRIDAKLIAEDLTTAQAHLLVGEILGRIALPKPLPVPPGHDAEQQPSSDSAALPLGRRWTGIERLSQAMRAVGRRRDVGAPSQSRGGPCSRLRAPKSLPAIRSGPSSSSRPMPLPSVRARLALGFCFRRGLKLYDNSKGCPSPSYQEAASDQRGRNEVRKVNAFLMA
jgi:hypothetical protein